MKIQDPPKVIPIERITQRTQAYLNGAKPQPTHQKCTPSSMHYPLLNPRTFYKQGEPATVYELKATPPQTFWFRLLPSPQTLYADVFQQTSNRSNNWESWKLAARQKVFKLKDIWRGPYYIFAAPPRYFWQFLPQAERKRLNHVCGWPVSDWKREPLEDQGPARLVEGSFSQGNFTDEKKRRA